MPMVQSCPPDSPVLLHSPAPAPEPPTPLVAGQPGPHRHLLSLVPHQVPLLQVPLLQVPLLQPLLKLHLQHKPLWLESLWRRSTKEKVPEHNTQIYLDDIIDYRCIFNGNSFSVVLLAMDRCRDHRGCGQHSTWKWRSKWKCTTSPRARSDIKLRLGWTALSQQISLLWLLLFGAGKPSLFPPNHNVSASTSQSGFQERWRQRSMNGPGWPVRRSHSTRRLCGTTASGTCHMSLAATGSLASAPCISFYFGLDSPMINICLCLFLFKIQIVLVVGQFFSK